MKNSQWALRPPGWSCARRAPLPAWKGNRGDPGYENGTLTGPSNIVVGTLIPQRSPVSTVGRMVAMEARRDCREAGQGPTGGRFERSPAVAWE